MCESINLPRSKSLKKKKKGEREEEKKREISRKKFCVRLEQQQCIISNLEKNLRIWWCHLLWKETSDSIFRRNLLTKTIKIPEYA